MFIIRACLKALAVLGIALVTLLLVAVMVKGLLGVRLHQGEGAGATATDPGATPAASASGAQATSDQGSQTLPGGAASDSSGPGAESVTALPKPPASTPEPSSSSADPSEKPLTVSRDSSRDAGTGSKLAAGAASTTAQSSSTPPRTPADQATADPSLPLQGVSEPTDKRYYRVKAGDTLYSIARQVYGNGKYWKVIYDANKDLIRDPVKLKLQWELELPPPDIVLSEN